MPSRIVIKTNIPAMRAAVARVLPQVIDETADQLMLNIEMETKRPHHGRVYPSRREPGATHQASAPGESFATDTESLIATMKKNRIGPLATEIQFNDERWMVLEFGGRFLAARPTVTRTAASMEDGFAQDVARALIDALTAAGG